MVVRILISMDLGIDLLEEVIINQVIQMKLGLKALQN